jgi:hypothetical protein
MPFSILQHRRGTTQEWQELDLIPKDGELVIEECLDGTRKCKIGNGKTRFSKLPYIADYAKNELLLEINKLESLIAETQQDTLNKAQVEIDKLDEAFGKRLSSNMKAILDKVIDFNENTLKDAKIFTQENQNRLTEQVYSDLDLKVSPIVLSLTQLETTINENVLPTIAELKTAEDLELNAVVEELTLKICEAKENLTALITEKDAKIETTSKALDDKINNLKATIETDLRPKVSQGLQETKELITSTKNNLATDFNDKVQAILNQMDSINAELSKDFTTLQESFISYKTETALKLDNLDTAIVSINNKIAELKTSSLDHLMAINDISNYCKLEFQHFRKDYEDDISGQNLTIDNFKDELNKKLDDFYIQADETLEGQSQEIQKILNTLQEANKADQEFQDITDTNLKDILSQIESLSERTQSTYEDLISTKFTCNEAIENFTKKLSLKGDSDSIENLENLLANYKNDFLIRTGALEEQLRTLRDNLNTSISELRTSATADHSLIVQVQESLQNDYLTFVNTFTEFRNTILEDIKALDQNFTDFSKDISLKVTLLEKKNESTFADLEKGLSDVVEFSRETQDEAVRVQALLQNKIAGLSSDLETVKDSIEEIFNVKLDGEDHISFVETINKTFEDFEGRMGTLANADTQIAQRLSSVDTNIEELSNIISDQEKQIEDLKKANETQSTAIHNLIIRVDRLNEALRQGGLIFDDSSRK